MMYDEQVEQDLVREHCAAYEAADAIERLADENTQLVTTANELSKMYDKLVDEMPDGWIPVTERLPEEIRMPVLVVDGRDVIEGYVNAIGEWMDFHGNRLKMVSHWMPLPEPPKEKT